jgi:hypothetical protein
MLMADIGDDLMVCMEHSEFDFSSSLLKGIGSETKVINIAWDNRRTDIYFYIASKIATASWKRNNSKYQDLATSHTTEIVVDKYQLFKYTDCWNNNGPVNRMLHNELLTTSQCCQVIKYSWTCHLIRLRLRSQVDGRPATDPVTGQPRQDGRHW